tara:strand:+ start:570 stop:1196 length:627 start_codon:yes stop_codon:yes gene_type:complete
MGSIFIADANPIVMRGLKGFLEEKGYTIVGMESNGSSALNFIIEKKPEIAILDIQMPFVNGVEIAEQCLNIKSKSKIILMTGHKEINFYLKSKKFNIYGYLLKGFLIEEIEDCINSVSNNIPYFSKKSKKTFGYTTECGYELNNLTKGEIRIVKLIAQFKTNQKIADLLFLSKRTIENHRSNIVTKLDLKKKPRALNVWVEKNMHLFN